MHVCKLYPSVKTWLQVFVLPLLFLQQDIYIDVNVS